LENSVLTLLLLVFDGAFFGRLLDGLQFYHDYVDSVFYKPLYCRLEVYHGYVYDILSCISFYLTTEFHFSETLLFSEAYYFSVAFHLPEPPRIPVKLSVECRLEKKEKFGGFVGEALFSVFMETKEGFPISSFGISDVPSLEDFVNKGEELVEKEEFSPEEAAALYEGWPEELKGTFKAVWSKDQVQLSDFTQKMMDYYHTSYTRSTLHLSFYDLERLRYIAAAKGVKVKDGKREDYINAIIEAQKPEEIPMPKYTKGDKVETPLGVKTVVSFDWDEKAHKWKYVVE